jgi:RNAse (barnase) inhibitor barstar
LAEDNTWPLLILFSDFENFQKATSQRFFQNVVLVLKGGKQRRVVEERVTIQSVPWEHEAMPV